MGLGVSQIRIVTGCTKREAEEWLSGGAIPPYETRALLAFKLDVPPDVWGDGKRIAAYLKAHGLGANPAEPETAPPHAREAAPEPEPGTSPATPPEPTPEPRPAGSSSIEGVDALIAEIRAEKAAAKTPAEKKRARTDEAKMLTLKARLEREQSFLEDRIVRQHPAWIKLREKILSTLKRHPEAMRDLMEVLDG